MLFERYRQRYGGYLVHLGLVMLAVGIIGSHFFQVQQDAVLKPGQEMDVAGYKLVYFGNIDRTYPDVEILTAQLQVWRDGQLQQFIYPGRQLYTSLANQPTSLISITTYGLTDLYVFLADWNGASEATIRVFVNPLVPLVWLGGIIMLVGGIICWWPPRRKRPITLSELKAVPVPDPVGAMVVSSGGETLVSPSVATLSFSIAWHCSNSQLYLALHIARFAFEANA